MTAATITILGRLGKDPELKQTPSGQTVAKFSLAVTNRDKSTTWFNCDAWAKSGEVIAQYAKKGDMLYVSGPFAPREYQGKNGSAVSYDVNVQTFAFAGGKKDDAPAPAKSSYTPPEEDVAF